MAIRMPKVPKVRVSADVSLQDGSHFRGEVFVEATTRIQDLMNAPEPFFPFVDDTGQVRLINKASVVQLTPHD
ncbi:MAG: hypothetical protein JJ899_08000 [Alphaproteobacteria bacterium]|nr:hypothetical protein [Alphaproteobacteria bacterium]